MIFFLWAVSLKQNADQCKPLFVDQIGNQKNTRHDGMIRTGFLRGGPIFKLEWELGDDQIQRSQSSNRGARLAVRVIRRFH